MLQQLKVRSKLITLVAKFVYNGVLILSKKVRYPVPKFVYNGVLILSNKNSITQFRLFRNKLILFSSDSILSYLNSKIS